MTALKVRGGETTLASRSRVNKWIFACNLANYSELHGSLSHTDFGMWMCEGENGAFKGSNWGPFVVSKCQTTSRWWPFPCVCFNVRQFHAPLSEPQASTPRQKSHRKPMSHVVLPEIRVWKQGGVTPMQRRGCCSRAYRLSGWKWDVPTRCLVPFHHKPSWLSWKLPNTGK